MTEKTDDPFTRAVDGLREADFDVWLAAHDCDGSWSLRWSRKGSRWRATGDLRSVAYDALAWLSCRETGCGDESAFAEDESRR